MQNLPAKLSEGERDLVFIVVGTHLFRIAEAQRDLDRAAQAWRDIKALQLEESNLAWILAVRLVFLMAQAGDFARVRQYLKRVQGRRNRLLAEGYLLWAQGQRDEARTLWEQAVKTEPAEGDEEEELPYLQALVMLGPSRVLLDYLPSWEGPQWEREMFRALALAQEGDLDGATAAMERGVKWLRSEEILQRQIPLHYRRLWKDFLSPEAWERLEPFFAPEPA
ncbi:MAG: hypothetical protein ACP5UM_14990 [Anaerolineae bacterium]